MLHVGADLMGATRLEHTLYQRGIAETLNDTPVGDSVFAHFGVIIYGHDAAVFLRACDVALHGARVLIEVAPDKGGVFALGGVVEELLGEHHLRGLVLGDEQQSGGVLFDAVDEVGLQGPSAPSLSFR